MNVTYNEVSKHIKDTQANYISASEDVSLYLSHCNAIKQPPSMAYLRELQQRVEQYLAYLEDLEDTRMKLLELAKQRTI
jgi:hypothetical protein